MLKNINPNLSAELLFVLDSMGHGDELVITDCNFPSYSTAAKTVTRKPVFMDGLDFPILIKAILSVFPLDSFAVCNDIFGSKSSDIVITNRKPHVVLMNLIQLIMFASN